MNETKEELRARFVGKTLDECPVPSVVLDLPKLHRNCQRMLDTVKSLDLGWRAHIKTHKTAELTRLQVEDTASTDVNIIVSTVLEAEMILPLLLEYKDRGRKVNVLYSFPIHASACERLAAISRQLGPNGLCVMVDHADQLASVTAIHKLSQIPPFIFVKVDMGYHRAGIIPEPWGSHQEELVQGLMGLHDAGVCVFHGLYTHGGHSYDTRRDWAALEILAQEFESLATAATKVAESRKPNASLSLVLSVGATPTVAALEHPALVSGVDVTNENASPDIRALQTVMKRLRTMGHALEVHAGVYPVLDLQQMATHARSPDTISAHDIAISVLADVASIYSGRGRDGTDEALVTAGSLALGREPCKDLGHPPGTHYAGWGILVPWSDDMPSPDPQFPAGYKGWFVGRISQEHGVLAWAGRKEDTTPLRVGQRVRIWPNHACIAGAGFDYYLVVDHDSPGVERVVDVWPRCRGW